MTVIGIIKGCAAIMLGIAAGALAEAVAKAKRATTGCIKEKKDGDTVEASIDGFVSLSKDAKNFSCVKAGNGNMYVATGDIGG